MVSGLGVSKGYKLDFSRKEYTLSQDLTLITDYIIISLLYLFDLILYRILRSFAISFERYL